MVRWCEHGPAGARVDAVDVTWEPPEGDADVRSPVGSTGHAGTLPRWLG